MRIGLHMGLISTVYLRTWTARGSSMPALFTLKKTSAFWSNRQQGFQPISRRTVYRSCNTLAWSVQYQSWHNWCMFLLSPSFACLHQVLLLHQVPLQPVCPPHQLQRQQEEQGVHTQHRWDSLPGTQVVCVHIRFVCIFIPYFIVYILDAEYIHT